MPHDGPGRPRSETSRRAVLEAARDLLPDGYERLTIEGIATRAGVSRQTIYRWWPSKAAILADAVIGGHIQLDLIILPSTGAVRQDLRSWLVSVARVERRTTDLVLALTAAAASDPTRNQELYQQLTRPDRQAIVDRLQSAIADDQLRPDADIEAAADAILGSLLFQTLQGHPMTEAGAEGLANVVIDGLTT